MKNSNHNYLKSSSYKDIFSIKFCFLFFLIFISNRFINTVNAQNKSKVEIISSSLEKFNSALPQEKIYLHFDKEYYFSGDTVWFKTYKVNASTHKPDSLSEIVYVDVINPQNKIIFNLKIKNQSGASFGKVSLPDTLKSGNYIFRAYTQWMRNFDSSFFFYKTIPVYSPENIILNNTGKSPQKISEQQKLTLDTVTKSINVDLQFFPEGGDLLDGLSTKVAFKAISDLGKEIMLNGSIVDQNGKVITYFKTNNFGIGYFNLLPQIGNQYFARIEGKSLDQDRIPLPDVIKNGYVLSVNFIKPGYLRVVARTNLQHLSDTFLKEMSLVGQCRGEVYFTAIANVNKKGYFFIDIPKSVFPTGIVQFTLFDANKVPQSERLTFINHLDVLDIEVSTDKNIYSPGEKVELNIQVSDKNWTPIKANLSISVTDATQVSVLDSLKENMVTNLLLSSDLKGHIGHPQVYLRDTTQKTQAALDVLMLTNGWRRFVWKEILMDTLRKPSFSMEKCLSFSGRIENLKNEKANDKNSITLMLLNSPPTVVKSKVDQKDYFYFALPDFQDSLSLVLQTNNEKGKQKDMKIWIDDVGIPNVLENMPQHNKGFFEYFKPPIIAKNNKITDARLTLKEVVVTADKPAEKINFYLLQTIDVEGVEKSMNYKYQNFLYLIADQLKGEFARVVRADDGGLVLIVGMGSKIYSPEFVINGSRYKSFELPNIEIASIKTLEIGERFNPDGRFLKEIHITTYKDGYRRSYPEGINTFKIAGFTKVREFYSPKYLLPNSVKANDLRSTIYWNPNVQTDHQGRAKLIFYNSNKQSSYLINIEGISNDGKPGAVNNYKISKSAR